MLLADLATLALDHLCEIKTGEVDDNGPDADVPCMLGASRGSAPVASGLMLNPTNHAQVLFAFMAGFTADRGFFAFEGYHTESPTNPDTGQEWAQNEMEAYVARHGRGGVVHTALHAVAVNGAGDAEGVYRTYTIEDGKVRYSEMSSLAEAGGHLAEAMVEGINAGARGTAVRLKAAQEAGIDLNEALALTDIATGRDLREAYDVMVALTAEEHDHARLRILREYAGPLA